MPTATITDSFPRRVVPIFSGGGTRLPAHVGILIAMKELGIEFNNIVGVSGGSIIASLLSSGMALEAIKKLTLETDFNQFRGLSLIRLIKDGGLSTGDKLESWLDKQLNGAKFKDLKMNFHVLATDINGGGPVIFNRTTTPDLKVSKAVRFSISIPLVYTVQTYEDHVLVDGAILSEDALFRDWAGDQTPSLCFRLKSEPHSNKKFKKPFLPLKSYVLMIIKTFMNAISREYVQANYWHNTIIVNTGAASAVDFNMTEAEKQELYQAGYNTALEFIPKKFRHAPQQSA